MSMFVCSWFINLPKRFANKQTYLWDRYASITQNTFFWNTTSDIDGASTVFHFRCTNAFKINRCDRDIWSKILIFKRAFHKLRILPHLCPPHKLWQLMRALKWGTLKGFPSRDIRMAKGQSFRLLTSLNKKSIFKDF